MDKRDEESVLLFPRIFFDHMLLNGRSALATPASVVRTKQVMIIMAYEGEPAIGRLVTMRQQHHTTLQQTL